MKIVCLVVLTVLPVLAVTLFPGDLTLQEQARSSLLILESSKFSDMDIALNIFLFVPFGFALAQLLAGRLKLRYSYGLVAVTCAGFALSFIVECLQALTSTRVSSVFDVASNMGGAFLGFICYSAYEAKSISQALFLYVSVVILFSAILQRSTTLRNWDLSYPLVLGNEATGDRPWAGRILQLHLFDSAISQRDAPGHRGLVS
jgi:glycopeptide antibiotics resistance protein